MKRKLVYNNVEEESHVANEIVKLGCAENSDTDEDIIELVLKQTLKPDDIHGTDQIDFEPVHFLRCHSRKNDKADVQTQVWQCAFEPDVDFPSRNTDIVATCGGNSVCFINVASGKVKQKYSSQDLGEMFYTLSWSTLKLEGCRSNILAVAGAKRTIHLIHPANNTNFFEYKHSNQKRSTVYHYLLFHPSQPNILFCSASDGSLLIFNIGSPCPPRYNMTFDLMQTLTPGCEMFNVVYSMELGILLAASSDGLLGWGMSDVVLEEWRKKVQQLTFELPRKPDLPPGEKSPRLVDSVELVKDTIVAAKCALHGVIYLWDLRRTLARGKAPRYTVLPVHILQWSDTDNYFMNMGAHSLSGLLACGDDRGRLWVYNMDHILKGPPSKMRSKPTVKLDWPEVTDEHILNRRKLRLDVYDILVDKVAVSSEGKHIVAVTNNNMVCIWRRVHL